MKLIIQIPCLNEAESLPVTLAELPRAVEGFDAVEWLVIDDGSTDDTSAVARAHGVDHVVRHSLRRGLAAAFMTGVDAALRAGADVIVNTDADNQYNAADIPALVAPIVAKQADLVIGARPIDDTPHFSWIKKKLQRVGSRVVRIVSRTDVADAPSGFRALTREAAMRLNVFTTYTYTLETIIQAGLSNLRVVSVPIRTNRDLRPSRLIGSLPRYVRHSILTMIRVLVIYRPLPVFLWLGGVLMLIGLGAGVRFLYFYAIGQGSGHVQSVILAATGVMLGTMFSLMGVLADLVVTNRKLLERIDHRTRRLEADLVDREARALRGDAGPR